MNSNPAICVWVSFFSPYLLYIAKELLFSVKLALQSPDMLLGSGCEEPLVWVICALCLPSVEP